VEPPLAQYANGHVAACHHPQNVEEREIAAATFSPLSPVSAGRLMPSGQEAPADSGLADDAGSADAAPAQQGS
jgi:hypothetical protein